MKYEFFTILEASPTYREYRWKWRDSEQRDESARDFDSLRACIEDARRHGFLESKDGRENPVNSIESHRLR
jgi:hypothetical protein